ncbi:preprotein translocase subunit SecA [Puniceicoccales bacterium CK1056]|uniref:Protein translocase subunit SecA n=1 Tax=Oceanipulchritudo coccoides TaxID=2706888 RepID=A0A6B2LYL3_9BACT|nr:preprotein translocase subunit SecA [Oceanipulchritudo coccoides]NDV61698.1 preprotein translocase subunit SecA [Oceanipulchritudo coccoides]
MISKVLKRFSGSHYRRFIKKAQPIVERINKLELEYQSLSDAQLQAKTDEFRKRYKEGETLDDLLPEAFATVKNAARRLCGQEIEYVGTKDTWNMVHFDVQLIGGMCLHQNSIAEMATGEGKTLVATLPLYLNSLAGRGAQLVTVNEYLAQRDAEWMGHIYKFLGLTVGVIKGGHQQDNDEKRAAYNCDITYGTASEFGFDYLRDNGMAMSREAQVQNDHFFCIIDEVDSILIDEARTPLIISGPVEDDSSAPFLALRPQVEKLAKEQKRLCNKLVSDAKAIMENPDVDHAEGLYKMLQVKQGMPKNKILLRLLEVGKIRKEFDAYDLEMSADYNKKQAYALKEELFFSVDEKQRSSDLTERGRMLLRPDNPDAFVLPDLPTMYMEIDNREDLEPKEKAKLKAQEQTQFEQISEEIHIIGQLLRAFSLYERDVEYVVQDGKVMIVDENTGRVMPGRRWSDGLHQAVEAKEGVKIEKESKTYATITLQNYFRLYEKLAGMTGTAETEANEFKDIYNLNVMVIPTNQPNIRIDENDIIYKTRREKYNAVIDEITQAHERGQPCLVGTVSVDSSEVLSRMLKRAKIPHSVLNAKYHAQEAEIITRAGHRGAVTIATNMAGRGTDIKLGEGIADLGGLYVIGTERHTSRRIDRQLRGRCARQGDPGKSRSFLSLEDELMRLYSQGSAGKLLESSFEEGEPLEHRWLNPMIERAQKTVEQHHYSIRKRLLQYDDVGSKQREVIYALRNEAITSDTPKTLIFELIEEELESRAEEFGVMVAKSGENEKEIKDYYTWLMQTFPIRLKIDDLKGIEGPDILKKTLERIEEAYQLKEEAEEPEALRRLERIVLISNIDRHYQNHLTEMEDLRQSVGLRGYGQKDPLVEYKNEAFVYFDEMLGRVRGDICSSIFRSVTNVRAFESMVARLRDRAREQGPTGPDGEQPQLAGQGGTPGGGGSVQLPKVKKAPVRIANEPGRNEMVVIQRGPEKQEMKWKKAERLVKEDGWQLVGKA